MPEQVIIEGGIDVVHGQSPTGASIRVLVIDNGAGRRYTFAMDPILAATIAKKLSSGHKAPLIGLDGNG